MTVYGEKGNLSLKSPSVDEIISHIRVGYSRDFPSVDPVRFFSSFLSPP